MKKKTAIHIGVRKGALKEARKAIMDILNSDDSGNTKRAALQALSTLCSVNGTTITNCTFKT